jgi:hypothetical protein
MNEGIVSKLMLKCLQPKYPMFMSRHQMQDTTAEAHCGIPIRSNDSDVSICTTLLEGNSIQDSVSQPL